MLQGFLRLYTAFTSTWVVIFRGLQHKKTPPEPFMRHPGKGVIVNPRRSGG